MEDNGGELPEWADEMHDALGSGYYVEPAFLILLALGIFMDYWDMNRVGDKFASVAGGK